MKINMPRRMRSTATFGDIVFQLLPIRITELLALLSLYDLDLFESFSRGDRDFCSTI